MSLILDKNARGFFINYASVYREETQMGLLARHKNVCEQRGNNGVRGVFRLIPMGNFFNYFEEELLNVADSCEDERLLSSFLLLALSIIIRFTDRLLRCGD